MPNGRACRSATAQAASSACFVALYVPRSGVRAHDRQDLLHQSYRSKVIDFEKLPRRGVGRILDRSERCLSRIADEDVEATVPRHDRGNDLAALEGVRHIESEAAYAPSDGRAADASSHRRMLATTVSTRAAKATTMASPKPELQP